MSLGAGGAETGQTRLSDRWSRPCSMLNLGTPSAGSNYSVCHRERTFYCLVSRFVKPCLCTGILGVPQARPSMFSFMH